MSKSTLLPEEIMAKVEEFRRLLCQANIDPVLFEHLIQSKKWNNIVDLFQGYANAVAPWYEEMVNAFGIPEIQLLSKWFFFRSDTIEKQRREILVFLKTFPVFRANDVKDIAKQMEMHLAQMNLLNNNIYQFVNQIPIFGGPMQQKQKPIPLPPIVPLEEGGEQLNFILSQPLADN